LLSLAFKYCRFAEIEGIILVFLLGRLRLRQYASPSGVSFIGEGLSHLRTDSL
jgi:hypothetical protein